MDRSMDPLYGPPYGPPQNIAEKINRKYINRNDKKIWLTIWIDWLLVSRKIRAPTSAELTDSGTVTYCHLFRGGDVSKTRVHVLWRLTTSFVCLCFCLRHFVRVVFHEAWVEFLIVKKMAEAKTQMRFRRCQSLKHVNRGLSYIATAK